MMKDNPLLDGITLTGGDPFCQAAACAELARAAREVGLNVWAYSGWTYEQLQGLGGVWAAVVKGENGCVVCAGEGAFVQLLKGKRSVRIVHVEAAADKAPRVQEGGEQPRGQKRVRRAQHGGRAASLSVSMRSTTASSGAMSSISSAGARIT